LQAFPGSIGSRLASLSRGVDLRSASDEKISFAGGGDGKINTRETGDSTVQENTEDQMIATSPGVNHGPVI